MAEVWKHGWVRHGGRNLLYKARNKKNKKTKTKKAIQKSRYSKRRKEQIYRMEEEGVLLCPGEEGGSSDTDSSDEEDDVMTGTGQSALLGEEVTTKLSLSVENMMNLDE